MNLAGQLYSLEARNILGLAGNAPAGRRDLKECVLALMAGTFYWSILSEHHTYLQSIVSVLAKPCLHELLRSYDKPSTLVDCAPVIPRILQQMYNVQAIILRHINWKRCTRVCLVAVRESIIIVLTTSPQCTQPHPIS